MHVFDVMLRQNLRDVGLARIFVKELAFVSGERHGIDARDGGAVQQLSVLIERAKERGEIAREVDSALLALQPVRLVFRVSDAMAGQWRAFARGAAAHRCARCLNYSCAAARVGGDREPSSRKRDS